MAEIASKPCDKPLQIHRCLKKSSHRSLQKPMIAEVNPSNSEKPSRIPILNFRATIPHPHSANSPHNVESPPHAFFSANDGLKPNAWFQLLHVRLPQPGGSPAKLSGTRGAYAPVLCVCVCVRAPAGCVFPAVNAKNTSRGSSCCHCHAQVSCLLRLKCLSSV